MAALEAAERHLSEALRRLEAALSRQLSGGSGTGFQPDLAAANHEREALARDVAMLRGECDRLTAALRGAEQRNQEIQKVTETVARRLDGSISELDRMLEG